MPQKLTRTKKIFILAAVLLIALNLYVFVTAYPETYKPSPGINTSGSILAKDFSAYYVSAWRLWHNPSQIYHFGALGGAEPVIPAVSSSLQVPALFSADYLTFSIS